MAMIALKCPHIEVSYISVLCARERARARAFILPITKKKTSLSERQREEGERTETNERFLVVFLPTIVSLSLSLSRARFVRDLFSIGRRAVFFYLSFKQCAVDWENVTLITN